MQAFRVEGVVFRALGLGSGRIKLELKAERFGFFVFRIGRLSTVAER